MWLACRWKRGCTDPNICLSHAYGRADMPSTHPVPYAAPALSVGNSELSDGDGDGDGDDNGDGNCDVDGDGDGDGAE